MSACAEDRPREDVSGDDGVIKTILRQGDGERPAEHSRITATYVGTLANGEVFDRSGDGDGEPFTFVLGKGEVIRGWDIAFASMRVGEAARLEIRHDHGYGEAGLPGKIPPYAVLFFDVELLAAAAPDPAGQQPQEGAPLAIADGVPGTGQQAGGTGSQTRTLVVDGAPVALDHLGPIVLNLDGTVSRITNWDEMTEEEQKRTLRVVAKRNKARRAKLQAEGGTEGGGGGQ